MVKLRKTRRRTIEKNVRIELKDGSTIDCELTDISQGGARLTLFKPVIVPDEFTLILRYDLRRLCRTVHRTKNLLGVMFVGLITSPHEADFDLLADTCASALRRTLPSATPRKGRIKMTGRSVKISSSAGTGEFDCYVSVPSSTGQIPAIVLASAVHGVDKDMRDLADEFASHGVIAAAPDLFWRWLPGPLPSGDPRLQKRSNPRHEKITANETDMADTLTYLHTLPQFNGHAVAAGFCYGGPFAILGPKRLGYAAGVSCHGSRLDTYLDDLTGVTAPVCIIWGDKDTAAPEEVVANYRKVSGTMKNVKLDILPGILHGYMMPGSEKAYDAAARKFSMEKMLAILNGLGGTPLKRAS
jgi:carboxymethylenebutenolidase